MRLRWAAAGLVALVVAPAACSDSGPKEGEARLEVDGQATIERAGGERETVDDGADVRTGDRVTLDEGGALMFLHGGAVLELREGLVARVANTSVVMGDRPVLAAGDLLVTTPDSVDLEVDGTDVQVTDGAARLTRAFGMSVAAYDADVALDSAGVPAEVPALRQMVVPDLGRPPQHPRPITYREHDTWDRRFLGAAMDLGERLESIARGLTNSLPAGEGRTVGFFRVVLPGLEDERAFSDDLLGQVRDGRPGDTLVGAAITDLGERGDFSSRWDEVFTFHDDGAAWGIVTLDQAVRSEPLIGTVEDALDSFEGAAAFVQPQIAAPPGATPTTTPGSPGDPVAPGDPATPSGPDGPDGGTPTTLPGQPPPTTPPPTIPVTPPPPPEPPPLLGPVVDPVTDLADDLVGGLLGGLLG